MKKSHTFSCSAVFYYNRIKGLPSQHWAYLGNAIKGLILCSGDGSLCPLLLHFYFFSPWIFFPISKGACKCQHPAGRFPLELERLQCSHVALLICFHRFSGCRPPGQPVFLDHAMLRELWQHPSNSLVIDGTVGLHYIEIKFHCF